MIGSLYDTTVLSLLLKVVLLLKIWLSSKNTITKDRAIEGMVVKNIVNCWKSSH